VAKLDNSLDSDLIQFVIFCMDGVCLILFYSLVITRCFADLDMSFSDFFVLSVNKMTQVPSSRPAVEPHAISYAVGTRGCFTGR
jgi:hypothetical protein